MVGAEVQVLVYDWNNSRLELKRIIHENIVVNPVIVALC
jgi:hypothetical protein